MREFVESLRRLYLERQIDEKLVRDMSANGKIGDDEMSYILHGK